MSSTTAKSQATQQRILSAAAALFGSKGFDGTGLREVETASGVNRGLISYHFGNKEDLWKAVVDSFFSEYLAEVQSQRDLIGSLDVENQIRGSIRLFVRFSVRHRDLSRIMIQENLNPSWRLDWIIDQHLNEIRETMKSNLFAAPAGDMTAASLRYSLIGACMLPFLVSTEIKKTHDVDVFDDAFIEQHVDLVIASYMRPILASTNK